MENENDMSLDFTESIDPTRDEIIKKMLQEDMDIRFDDKCLNFTDANEIMEHIRRATKLIL